jgi:hypothetical protein
MLSASPNLILPFVFLLETETAPTLLVEALEETHITDV